MKANDTTTILRQKLIESSEDNFSKNLAEIFRSSIKSIISAEEYFEKKHKILLRSIIPNIGIIGNINFSKKIEILGDGIFASHLAEHPIQKFYILIFEALRNIYKDYDDLLKENPSIYNSPKNNYRESTEEKIYQTIINEELIKNDYFRNNFLTKILALQIPSENLRRMSNPTPGIPSDPAILTRRAKAGGEASNFGEHILLEEILIYLKNNRPKTDQEKSERKTIPKLYNTNSTGLEETLTNYINTHLDKNDTETGRMIRYGKKLTPDNLYRKFREWAKKSDELKNEINNHHFPLFKKSSRN